MPIFILVIKSLECPRYRAKELNGRRGAMNSSMPSSPLPSLSNFLKSRGMSTQGRCLEDLSHKTCQKLLLPAYPSDYDSKPVKNLGTHCTAAK